MNVFENKKFGDILKTRDGRKAVYIGEWQVNSKFTVTPTLYKCWVENEDEPFEYNEEGKDFNGSYAELEDGTIESYGSDIATKIDVIDLLGYYYKYNAKEGKCDVTFYLYVKGFETEQDDLSDKCYKYITCESVFVREKNFEIDTYQYQKETSYLLVDDEEDVASVFNIVGKNLQKISKKDFLFKRDCCLNNV